MAKSNRRVSASFTLFINLFLVLSTVIGFAVLIFLSYENLRDNYVSEVKDLTNIYSSGIANDIDFLVREKSEQLSGEEYLDMLFTVMDSKNRASGCNLILLDQNCSIIHRSVYSPNTITYDLNYLLANANLNVEGFQYGEIRGNSVIGFTINQVPNSEYFLAAVKSENTDSLINEFKNVIFYPWMLAVILSLVLCLTFIYLSMKPIREMSNVIGKVAEGDYSVRVSKKFTSDNEFTNDSLSSDLSDMARTVNYMIDILENQEHDRNIFISSVAHDIRTPLTSINGFITAMIDGIIPEEMYVKYFDMIKHEVERIRLLVNSMTEASSLSHVDPSTMEVFSFSEVVDDILAGLEPQFNQKYILAIKDFDDKDRLEVYGDAHMLSRVVYNIVSNAIKFTPNGGKIKITAYRDNKAGRLRISIDDSGPGVPEDKRARVFESFYKLDSSRKQEGFGLGLYICKQILVGHGQSIYLDESATLGGASFKFTFALPREEIEKSNGQ